MAKRKPAKSNADWRALLEGPNARKTKTVAWTARLRIFFSRAKKFAAFAAVAAAGYGAYFLYSNAFLDDFFGSESESVKRIEFKTDGVITPKWIGAYIKLPKRTKLADVNIFAIKNAVESLSQVKSAKVERVYPDRLKITISEHLPMAKAVAKIDDRTVVFALSPDGTFYEPVCLSASYMNSMPLITGGGIRFKGRTPEPLKCADKLAEFLAFTQAKMPMQKWASIDIGELESVSPLISATTGDGVKIIFAPKDYQKQFDRLEYVLKYSEQNQIKDIRQIDLSLKERADVKLKSSKK